MIMMIIVVMRMIIMTRIMLVMLMMMIIRMIIAISGRATPLETHSLAAWIHGCLDSWLPGSLATRLAGWLTAWMRVLAYLSL